jgi:hypothetical protein
MSNKEEMCHYESFSVRIIYMVDDDSAKMEKTINKFTL